MKNEDKIIIELCNFYAPDVNFLRTALSQDIDLTYILGTLLMNRVGGVAYYTLSSNDLFGCLNREFVKRYIKRYIFLIYKFFTDLVLKFSAFFDKIFVMRR